MSEETGVSQSGRPPFRELLRRALLLRCMACGDGRPFTGLFGMRDACPECGYRYLREQGYFIGSIYFNYGITGIVEIVIFVLLTEVGGWTLNEQLPILLPIAIGLPALLFRHARQFWMLLDLNFAPPPELGWTEDNRAEERQSEDPP